MDIGGAGGFRPAVLGNFGPVPGQKSATEPQDRETRPETTPLDRACLSSLSSEFKARRVGLNREKNRAGNQVLASVSLGTTLGAAACLLGGPVGWALGGAALVGSLLGVASKVRQNQTERKLDQLDRVQYDLWNSASQGNIASQGNLDTLAVLQGQDAKSVNSSKPLSYFERYGPWAVVTGASSGIGREFAEQLAAKGINPVLVARDGEKLDQAAAEIEKKYGVQTRTIAANLANSQDLEKIARETSDLNVGLLVNNAGIWAEGEFLENDVERERAVLRVNTEAPMWLSSHFGKKLSERGSGGILNVGSALAHVPTAYQANYSASKAYLNHLTHALSFELKPQGVDVTIVNPGATKTEGTAHIDQDKMPIKPMAPKRVVEQALNGLGRTTEVIPGTQNRLAFGVAMRMIPQSLSTWFVGTKAAEFMDKA